MTGVQTCALPISKKKSLENLPLILFQLLQLLKTLFLSVQIQRIDLLRTVTAIRSLRILQRSLGLCLAVLFCLFRLLAGLSFRLDIRQKLLFPGFGTLFPGSLPQTFGLCKGTLCLLKSLLCCLRVLSCRCKLPGILLFYACPDLFFLCLSQRAVFFLRGANLF